MFKVKKIRSKILALVIIICVFSLISISISSYVVIQRLSDHSLQVNETLGHDAAKGAGDAMIEQAYDFMRIIAYEQSRSCSKILDNIRFNVLLMEGALTDISHNPQYYSLSRPIVKPSEATSGVYTNTYSLPKSVPMTDEIRKELKLLSNLSLIMSILAEDSNIMELYVGTKNGVFYNYTTMIFENPEYDPRNRPWYINALANPDDVIFTDVYEDAFGTGMVLTAAKAVFDARETFLGVAAVDIQLDNLKELILETRILDSGYTFILDNTGRYIVHPNMGKDGFNAFPLESEKGVEKGFADGYRQMMAGEEGFVTGEANGKRIFLVYCPIADANWSIGVVVYEEEVLSSLGTLTEQMDTLVVESENNIVDMSRQLMIIFIAVFIIVAIMVGILSVRLTHIVSKPIQKLAGEVGKISEGNFEYRIPVETNDEIGVLTEAFNNMTDNLYHYAQNIISLNLMKTELENAANTDALTGILNRRCFLKNASILNKTVSKAFVIMFDLDHFKKVNDTYGHPAGDEVLRTVTARVKGSIRSDDLFGRYGGEEFILFIYDTDEELVINLIERIRQNICKELIPFENNDIYISASFGIAAAAPINDLDTAIALSDKAMYRAKYEGRNRVCF